MKIAAAHFKQNELVELLTSPGDLFQRPFERSRWWRFALVTALCGIVGGLLFVSARQHVILSSGTHNSRLAMQLFATRFVPVTEVLVMVFGVSLSFALIAIVRPAFRMYGNLSDYWCIVNEIAVVKLGLSTLALGIIVQVIGPAHFATSASISRAMPSIASFLPHLTLKMSGILGTIDFFNVWTLVLYTIAFVSVGRTSLLRAGGAAFIMSLLPQIIVRSMMG
jgi:hypothetical protein